MLLNGTLLNLQKLNSYSFYWKDSINKFEHGKDLGLIAQEVEKVYPELVFEDSLGYKVILYYKLVPILLSAIKEQQEIITDQNNKLEFYNEELKKHEMLINKILIEINNQPTSNNDE